MVAVADRRRHSDVFGLAGNWKRTPDLPLRQKGTVTFSWRSRRKGTVTFSRCLRCPLKGQSRFCLRGNPVEGVDADTTFPSQSTFVLPIASTQDAFIFMSDRGKKTDLGASAYIWLPIEFGGDRLSGTSSTM